MKTPKKSSDSADFKNRIVSNVDDELALWIENERKKIGLTESAFVRMRLLELKTASEEK